MLQRMKSKINFITIEDFVRMVINNFHFMRHQVAAHYNNLDLSKLFLENGAAPDITADNGYTALQ